MNLFHKLAYRLAKKNDIIDTYNIGDQYPSWFALDDPTKLYNIYNTIPEIKQVIDYGAVSFSKGVWRFVGNDGKYKGHTILEKLNNPNPFQAWPEFAQQFYVFWKVFGNSYMFTFFPGSRSYDKVSTINNLPAQFIIPKLTKNIVFYQDNIENIISYYLYDNRKGVKERFFPDEILHLNDITIGDGLEYLIGKSRIEALKKPISNIIAAYEARNVIITKRGAFGIISPDNSGSGTGIQNLLPADKENLQKQYEKYGLKKSKWQIIFSSKSLKFAPITMDFDKLKLYDEVEEDFQKICGQFQTPREIFPTTSGTTFNNREQAKTDFYEDKIITEANYISSAFTRHFELEKEGQLILDYSKVSALQKNANEKAKRNETIVRTIIDVNKSIKEGYMSIDSGVAVLINIMDIQEDMARLLVQPGQIQDTGDKSFLSNIKMILQNN